MDHFFNLGSYRRGLVLASAALAACTFSFGQSDLTYLTSLVRSIDEHTDDISSDIVTLYYDQNEIKRLLVKVEDETFDVRSILSNLVFDSSSQLRVTDTGVLHRVSSIDSKMDLLLDSLTNNVPLCYDTAIFTNLFLGLSTAFAGRYWPSYGGGLNNYSYQWTLNMDQLMRGNYYDVWRSSGIWREFPMLQFSRLVYDELTPSLQADEKKAYENIFGTTFQTSNGRDAANLSTFARPYYYLYGTKQITQSFLQYTNQILFALNQINDSLTNYLDHRFISTSPSESGTSYGFTEVAGNVARGMSESATQLFSIEDDITQVETNTIVAISDSGYQSKMNQATSSNPSDGLGQAAEQLNSYLLEHETDLESILQDSSSDYTFYFAVPDFSLGRRSNTVRKAYVVPNTTSSTRPYLSFICGVIKFALSLYFAYYVWDNVVYELWKF